MGQRLRRRDDDDAAMRDSTVARLWLAAARTRRPRYVIAIWAGLWAAVRGLEVASCFVVRGKMGEAALRCHRVDGKAGR